MSDKRKPKFQSDQVVMVSSMRHPLKLYGRPLSSGDGKWYWKVGGIYFYESSMRPLSAREKGKP